MAHEYSANYEDVTLIYKALFLHPVSVQFWTDFFSYHLHTSVDEGKPLKLTYNDAFPRGVRNIWPFILFSRDATLTRYLDKLYERFGIPATASADMPMGGAVFNPMHLPPGLGRDH